MKDKKLIFCSTKLTCKLCSLPIRRICGSINKRWPNLKLPHFSISRQRVWFWSRRICDVWSSLKSPRNRIRAFRHAASKWSTLSATKCLIKFWRIFKKGEVVRLGSSSIKSPHWEAAIIKSSAHDWFKSFFCSIKDSWLKDGIDLAHRIERNNNFVAES